MYVGMYYKVLEIVGDKRYVRRNKCKWDLPNTSPTACFRPSNKHPVSFFMVSVIVLMKSVKLNDLLSVGRTRHNARKNSVSEMKVCNIVYEYVNFFFFFK